MPTEQKPETRRAAFTRTLEFDRVSFQHQSASSPALSENLVPRGAARDHRVCGPSGAGKTSLVKLLSASTAQRVAISFFNGTPEDQVQLKICVNESRFVKQTRSVSGSIRREPAIRAPGSPRTKNAWKSYARPLSKVCSESQSRPRLEDGEAG